MVPERRGQLAEDDSAQTSTRQTDPRKNELKAMGHSVPMGGWKGTIPYQTGRAERHQEPPSVRNADPPGSGKPGEHTGLRPVLAAAAEPKLAHWNCILKECEAQASAIKGLSLAKAKSTVFSPSGLHDERSGKREKDKFRFLSSVGPTQEVSEEVNLSTKTHIIIKIIIIELQR